MPDCTARPRAAAPRVDQQRTVGVAHMLQVRSAVAIGDDRQIGILRAQPGQAAQSFPRPSDSGSSACPTRRSPRHSISVHRVRSNPRERPMRRHIQIRARRQQHQVVARRTMRLEHGERRRSEAPAAAAKPFDERLGA